MTLSVLDVAAKLTDTEMGALMEKVIGKYDQAFNVLKIEKAAVGKLVEVRLVNGLKYKVVV